MTVVLEWLLYYSVSSGPTQQDRESGVNHAMNAKQFGVDF